MRPPNGGDFWRTHVWGRRKELLIDRAVWLSAGLAATVFVLAPHLPLATMSVPDLADMGVLYAALSFGAAIAGMGIAFGVPGAERIRRWSSLKSDQSRFSAFSNLAFVFSWAAMVQVAVVVVCFLAMAFGQGAQIIPQGQGFADAPTHYLALLFSLWLWWYALFSLTAVIRTVMQVANAIVTEETTEDRSKNPDR